jgi:hypothetical protein
MTLVEAREEELAAMAAEFSKQTTREPSTVTTAAVICARVGSLRVIDFCL